MPISRTITSAPGVIALCVTAWCQQFAIASTPLNIAWEAEPRAYDPRFAVDANSQYLENLIHCAPVGFNADGQAIPQLATSWSFKNPQTLNLKLNPAAKFADGAKVTANDIKATLNSMLKEGGKTPSPRKGALAKLKSIKVLSEHELDVELQEPDPTFVVNSLVIGILPVRLAEKDLVKPEDGLVGCGPYIVKSASSTSIELVANPHYGLSTPAKSPVVIKIVKDETTRYAKLSAGEIDIVQNLLGRDKLESISKSNPNLKVLRRPGLNTVYLGFNMRDPIVGQAKVRKAIALAIDRDKLIKFVLAGYATKASTLLTPQDAFFAKNLPGPTVDLPAAEKLLDEAGLIRDGKKPRFTLTFKTTTDLTRLAVAKAIAAELRPIGIEVKVETLEWGRFKADVEAGKVQMWSLSWIGFKDPDIYRFAFASESFPPNGGNRGFYSNPKLDALLNQGRLETDASKRQEIYNLVAQMISEEQPYVFLWHEDVFAVANKNIDGFELFADGRYASLKEAIRK